MVFERNCGKRSCPHTKKGAVLGAASKSAAKPLPAVGKKPPVKASNKSIVTHIQEQLDAARIILDGRNERLKATSLELERQQTSKTAAQLNKLKEIHAHYGELVLTAEAEYNK
eukprot:jgi/Tetstr1/466610/TSEL_011098.t1